MATNEFGDEIIEVGATSDFGDPVLSEEALLDIRKATEATRIATGTGYPASMFADGAQPTAEELGLVEGSTLGRTAGTVGDITRVVFQNAGAGLAGGLTGAVTSFGRLLDNEVYKAGEDVERVAETLSYIPKDPATIQTMTNIADAMKENVPYYDELSKALNWIKSTTEEGADLAADPKAMAIVGEEAVGVPFPPMPPSVQTWLSTSAPALPELLALTKTPSAAEKVLSTAERIKKGAEKVPPFKKQTEFKKALAKSFAEGKAPVRGGTYQLSDSVLEGDYIPAGMEVPDLNVEATKLIEGGTPEAPMIENLTEAVEEVDVPLQPQPPKPEKFLPIEQMIEEGMLKVEKSPLAKQLIDAGFDEGTVSVILRSTPETKTLMKEMLEIKRQGMEGKLEGLEDRAADVAGRALLARYKTILKANKKARADLDDIAKKELKGTPLNIEKSGDEFLSGLESMGVKLDKNGKLDFSKSDIRSPSLKKYRSFLSEVYDGLMDAYETGDALEVHKLKRLIDNLTTYGKVDFNLGGEANKIVSRLRKSINNDIRVVSDNYAKANDTLSATIDPLNELQRLAPTKTDLDSKYAEAAIGTLLRRVNSNASSRSSLIKLIDEMNRTAAKYGEAPNDNIKALVLFMDELEDAFGTDAGMSFLGQTERAQKRVMQEALSGLEKRGVIGATVDATKGAARTVKQAFSPTDTEVKFKLMQELLDSKGDAEKIAELREKFGL